MSSENQLETIAHYIHVKQTDKMAQLRHRHPSVLLKMAVRSTHLAPSRYRYRPYE
jgi:hypothetical protein